MSLQFAWNRTPFLLQNLSNQMQTETICHLIQKRRGTQVHSIHLTQWSAAILVKRLKYKQWDDYLISDNNKCLLMYQTYIIDLDLNSITSAPPAIAPTHKYYYLR